ncbi:MAG: HDIG domain-containing protein [Clostridia bacterium]|nr:HDIG domain-containing protein [Clostridia bacterium]
MTTRGGHKLQTTKLSKKQIALSLINFISGTIGLYIIVLLMMLMDKGTDGFVPYITEHSQPILTVTVAYAVLSAMLYCYFFFENRAVLTCFSKPCELFLIIYIDFFIAFIMSMYVHTLARPIAFLALMCATLFRRRDAIFINSISSLMLLFFDRILTLIDTNMYYSYALLLCRFCTGIVAVFIFNSIKTRFQSVIFAFILLIPVEVINSITILPVTGPSAAEVIDLVIFSGVSCILTVMLYMFILPIFELIFAEMTVFRLRELTSDSARLIKKLKETAPGTYSHSVVVSQLAEACAKAIGEDSELARAAAYYHDVGKLKGPEMFAENQTEYNFHDDITPELSVDIIRSHARNGAQLIRKSKLPEFFADVAIQHHGTLPIKYFYYKALKMSDGELNIENYSYSGPTPASKIAAIIMIADSSEAATRTLPDRSPEKVEAFVRTLIEERLDLGQFDNCNITMRELTIIKSTLVNQLTGVYHSRVVYPKLTISKKK